MAALGKQERDERTMVLVTGGSGLVGQALKMLLKKGGERDSDSKNWFFASSKVRASFIHTSMRALSPHSLDEPFFFPFLFFLRFAKSPNRCLSLQST